MYNRILELITESSAARRAVTRAQLARQAGIAANTGGTRPERSINLKRIKDNVPVRSSSEIDRAISDKAQPKQATSPETLKTQASRVGMPGNRTKPTKGSATTPATKLSKAAKQAIMAKGPEATRSRNIFGTLKMPKDQQAAKKAELQKKFPKAQQAATGPAADSDAIPGNPLAQKQQASNIVRALQGGGTTLTRAVLGKITPFMRSGLKTSKVGPVL